MGSGGAARTRCFPPAAKPCDYCKSAAALLFCRAESAFMCMSCDSKVHNNISALKHERVWMCEVCEQEPDAVTCKADAAALCVTCDNDIHCANPLASRHERSPILPFCNTAESMLLKSSAFPSPISGSADKLDNFITQNSYITDSWVSTNPIAATKYLENNRFVKPMEFLFSDSDQFLDFDSFPISSHPCSDSVVPVQTITKPPATAHLVGNLPEIQFDIDFKNSSITSYNNSYNNPSLSRSSISSSTMEVGVVPDGSPLSETSYPFARTMSSVDLSGNQGTQVVDMDREARVLRYKEKKKNRKFEKTIRYASRKAYAETRPRIKGRFVKRTDSEPDSTGFLAPVRETSLLMLDTASFHRSDSMGGRIKMYYY